MVVYGEINLIVNKHSRYVCCYCFPCVKTACEIHHRFVKFCEKNTLIYKLHIV